MLYWFAVFSSFVVEIMALTYFGALFFRKREKSITKNIIACIFAFAFCFFAFLFDNHLMIKLFAMLLLFAGFYRCLYQVGVVKAYVIGALWQSISFLIEYVLMLSIWVLLGSCFPFILETEYNQFLYAMYGKEICLLVLIYLFWKNRGHYVNFVESYSRREWCGLLITSLVPLGIITIVVHRYSLENREEHILLLITSIGIAVLYIFVFWLLAEMSKRNQQILLNEAIIGRISNEISLYRSLAEGIDRQQRITHEYKHHLSVMTALLDSGNIEELKGYLAKANGTVEAMSDVINTNNPIVNAILNTKYREAGQKQISMVFKIDDLLGLAVCEEDLVVILSNLLNNAIRAAAASEKKIVKIKFVLEDNQVILSIRNTYQGEIKEEQGRFLTTKEDSRHEHGIGVENVKECIEKHNGRYVIDYDEEYFSFSIVMENTK